MAVRRRSIIAEARIQYHASPFLADEVPQVSVFLQVLHFSLASSIPHIAHTRSVLY
jgi:hypothetical protein